MHHQASYNCAKWSSILLGELGSQRRMWLWNIPIQVQGSGVFILLFALVIVWEQIAKAFTLHQVQLALCLMWARSCDQKAAPPTEIARAT